LEQNKVVKDLVAQRKPMLKKIKVCMENTQKQYIKQANKGRHEVEYEEGQKMWLNVKNFTLLKVLASKFMANYAS